MKSIHLLFIASVVCIGISLSACDTVLRHQLKGSGILKSEKRTLTGFTGVDISGAIDARITAQKEYAVEIEADDNILPHIKAEVRNGTLHIYQEEGFSFSNANVIVHITLPELTALDVSGASKATAENIQSAKLHVDISGASSSTLRGTTEDLTTDISGASSLKAEELHAARILVDVSGASKSYVNASELLEADASGASSIYYSGNPKTIRQETSGASSIRRR